MDLIVTPVCAAALTPLFLTLSARVIQTRRSDRIGLGDRGNAHLLRRMRTQANFTEYAPFGMLLVLVLELMAANASLLWGLAAALVAGRDAHAYGFGSDPEKSVFRVAGMLLTLIMIGVAAGAALVLAIAG